MSRPLGISERRQVPTQTERRRDRSKELLPPEEAKHKLRSCPVHVLATPTVTAFCVPNQNLDSSRNPLSL